LIMCSGAYHHGQIPWRDGQRRARTPTARRRGAFAAVLLLTVATALAMTGMAATSSAAMVSPAAPSVARPAPTGLGGQEWTAVKTSSKIVALTLDAGANADGLKSILGTLSEDRVPATFFLTGDFTKSFPAQARAIVAAGYRVGDHSMTHPYFTKLTDAQMRDQVLNAQREIISVTGADPWPWFRFPYGDRNAHTISVVNSVGFVPVGWTVDTLGWEGTSGGITVQKIVNRVLANLKPGEIVLMHCGSNPTDHSTLDADALPAVISDLKARGYSFVTLDAMLGYRVLLGDGDIRQYATASFGSSLGKLPTGFRTVGIAADHSTGGYWVLKSDGGVNNFNAPWSGSLYGKLPARVKVTAIAAGRNDGYLILTSDGNVHGFARPLYGSDLGRLPAGVTAVGLTIDTVTGGYWILTSNGGVDNFNAPSLGSLAGRLPSGVRPVAIAAGNGGYYLLTSNGDFHAFGAPGHGSLLGKLPAGVTAVGLAVDAATGGYWVLKSNGGVNDFNAPWYGSLANKLGSGQIVTGIVGQ